MSGVWTYLPWISAYTGILALGAGVSFRSTRRQLQQCAACRYDLAGIPLDAVCPECGGQARRTMVESVQTCFSIADSSRCAAVLTVAALWGALAPAVIWGAFDVRLGYGTDLAVRLSLTGQYVPAGAATDAALAATCAASLWVFGRRAIRPMGWGAALSVLATAAIASALLLWSTLRVEWNSGAVFRPGSLGGAWLGAFIAGAMAICACATVAHADHGARRVAGPGVIPPRPGRTTAPGATGMRRAPRCESAPAYGQPAPNSF